MHYYVKDDNDDNENK